MTWTLNVDFLGLAALMPLDDDRWLVALPDLKNGSDLAGLPSRLDSHQALVAVAPSNLDGDASTANERLRVTSAATGDWSFFDLDRHYVHFGEGGSSVNVIRDESELDIGFVPSIDEVVSEAAGFDGSLLSDWFGEQIAPSPSAARIAATVLLDRGRLSTRKLLVEDSGGAGQAPSQFEFRSSLEAPAVRPAAPMADGFRLAFEIEDEQASLFLGDRDGEESTVIIKPNGSASEATVQIHNEEIEDILGFEIELVDPRLGDVDFAIFYTLSTGWPELAITDLPVPFRISTGGGGRNRPCRGSQYRQIVY